MTQQINLYSPVFRTKPTSFGWAWFAALLVLLLGLAIAAWAGGRYQLKRIQAQARQLELSRANLEHRMQSVLAQTAAASAPPSPTASANLQTGKLLAALEESRRTRPFSSYFDGFAQAQADGVWLTGFSVRGGRLAVQGRVLAANQLPAYLAALDRQTVFSGSHFDSLKMNVAEPGGPLRFDLENRDAGKESP